ncbi:hypothetical protein AMTRI_Chr13g88940 [Amborella trichopoda]
MTEEMDMDMPLQDELEWLEHCASHQHEEEFEEPEPDEPPSSGKHTSSLTFVFQIVIFSTLLLILFLNYSYHLLLPEFPEDSILSPPALKKSVLFIGNIPENKRKSPEGNAGKEMDMDMDMPLSHELEWLEHHASHHYEDFEEAEIVTHSSS